jgi:hypothetical protein
MSSFYPACRGMEGTQLHTRWALCSNIACSKSIIIATCLESVLCVDAHDLFRLQQSGLEEELTRRSVTHSAWDLSSSKDHERRNWHPVTYKVSDATPALIKSIKVCFLKIWTLYSPKKMIIWCFMLEMKTNGAFTIWWFDFLLINKLIPSNKMKKNTDRHISICHF